jgi:hypothetical protein
VDWHAYLQAEALRLAGILEAFPTSEQQDRELLGSGSLLDWRERVIVKLRMLRKEALRLTVEGIHAALQGAQPVAVPLLEGDRYSVQHRPLPTHGGISLMKEL